MKKVIQWRQGYQAKVSAEKAAEELEKIRKRDGAITPTAVVESARPEKSPIHKVFEWDDSIAAEKYRIDQANRMTRAVQVIHLDIKKPNQSALPARMFSSITVTSPDDETKTKKVYTSTEDALQDPITRDEILGNAIRDAIAYRRKYAALQELAQVFVAIDSFIEAAKA